MSKERNDLYEFGGFRLDVSEHTLTASESGRNINLPEKAFQTLCVLVENSGRLISKSELIERIWPDSFVEENNLDKCIHAIRNALGEKTGGQKFIETVRKHGYRFVADVSAVPRRGDGDEGEASGEEWNSGGNGSPHTSAPQSAHPTVPRFSTAFEAYQQARIRYYQMTAPGAMEARVLIDEALRLDPDFAPSYSLSAELTTLEVIVGLKAPGPGFAEARDAIKRAYELGADSADFYAAAAYVDLIADWDFAAAEKNLRKALEINAHHSSANRMMGEVFMFQGRHDEAAYYVKQAQTDELTLLINANILAISRFLARDFVTVVAVCDRMLSLYPRFIIPAWTKCWALEQLGRPDEAIDGYEKILRLPYGEPALRWAGVAYALAGDRERALETAARLESASLQHSISPTHIAAIYAALGEAERAEGFLQEALEMREPFMLWVPTDPRFDALRGRPAFERIAAAVLEKRSPEAAMPLDAVKAAASLNLSKAQITESGQHVLFDLEEFRAAAETGLRQLKPNTPPAIFENAAIAPRPPAENGTEVTGVSSKLESRSGAARFKLAFAGILVAAAAGFGAWYIGGRQPAAAPILSQPFSTERISTDGKVFVANIAPNGKFAVYSQINPDKKWSLWLRDLATGHNTEIAPPSAEYYHGLEFSPDSEWLYFVRRAQIDGAPTDTYRVPVRGGVPQRVVSDTQGWLSISPDGKLIAFVRCRFTEEEFCSLNVADAANGANERKLLTRRRPYRFRDMDFSPDGKLLAFATGQSENAGMDFTVAVYDLEEDKEKEITQEKFFNVTGVAWLPDQRALLLTAARIPNKVSRIWQLEVDSGRATPITKDSETYLMLSLDRAATTLVSTRYEEDFRTRVIRIEDSAEAFVLPRSGTMGFGGNGNLYYSSTVTGNPEIWVVGADGTGKRQLTNDPAEDLKAVPGPDNRIYFSSNRSGSAHVWRMNLDGTDPVQVTRDNGGFPIAVSPDGEWVFYHHGLDRGLWKVSTKGGGEQAVLSQGRLNFAISPDASRAAYQDKFGDRQSLVVVSMANGEKTDHLKLPLPKAVVAHASWLPDGSGLIYTLSDGEPRTSTVWVHRFNSRETPTKLLQIDEELNELGGLAISPNGKYYAVSHGGWRHDAVLLKGLR
jgi:DNA-binding winged helix-turn-helix (wHTH) protein/Tol biopolymer transport system component/tetratricopeptide (TPR) repeat protein